MAAVQAPLDLGLCPAQAGTGFFTRDAPALSLPAHRVVGGHAVHHAHTQDLFQAMLPPQRAMRIASLCRFDGELLPLG